MKHLFEEVFLGKLKISNRLIRSATLEMDAVKNGVIDVPLMKGIYSKLAEGGVGLIITGMMGVGYNSCVGANMAKIYGEDFRGAFQAVVAAAHQCGCKIVAQLGQCGAKAREIDFGDHPLAPSDIAAMRKMPAKAMSKSDIKRVVSEFAEAALKCREAGADGVQLHAAHGYLLSQFLSPYYNKRQDEYGGSPENRARILMEICDAVRLKAGKDYPLFVKINFSDLTDPGLQGHECVSICKELEKRGVDAIEVSSGLAVGAKSIPSKAGIGLEEQGFFAGGAMEVAGAVNIPVVSVGGYRSPDFAEETLNRGNIAAISLSRPLVREPGLVKRWKAGDLTPSQCVSCNGCFAETLKCSKLS
ncbi:MAG: NADH:flavin oxidoreductase [Acidaminococcales bacterium]|jgi:2,4-dienoyl-CoA reductase-like NADH-dependent reductase (Old Yellow Enzyme family)|nr:NADH:flavin oxidoreductase [Acidaminococcales bacterium]